MKVPFGAMITLPAGPAAQLRYTIPGSTAEIPLNKDQIGIAAQDDVAMLSGLRQAKELHPENREWFDQAARRFMEQGSVYM